MLTSSVRAIAKASMAVNPMKKTRTSMKGMAMKAALKGMSTQSRKKTVTSMQGMAMKGDMKVAKGAAKKSVSPQKVTNALRAAMKAMKKVLGHEEDRIENWSWYDVRGVDHLWVVASTVGARNKIEVQAYGQLDI